MAMKGRNMGSAVIGVGPRGPKGGKRPLKPGDYWRLLHPITGEPVRPDDGFWGKGNFSSNLTGAVWAYMSPDGGGLGTLVLHTVREHDDGTISVRPSDGSSNSILHHGHIDGKPTTWHGYIEHGIWRPV